MDIKVRFDTKMLKKAEDNGCACAQCSTRHVHFTPGLAAWWCAFQNSRGSHAAGMRRGGSRGEGGGGSRGCRGRRAQLAPGGTGGTPSQTTSEQGGEQKPDSGDRKESARSTMIGRCRTQQSPRCEQIDEQEGEEGAIEEGQRPHKKRRHVGKLQHMHHFRFSTTTEGLP